MKSIIHTPNPVLTTPAKKVDRIDHKIRDIVSEMKETLLKSANPKGVGLAAPQVGILLRIFLMRPEEDGPITTYINPKLVSKSKKTVKGIPGSEHKLEGCLSIPKVWGMVKRHKEIELEYQDEQGKIKTEKLTGFAAIIAQHELDHLEGILFSRRVIEQKGTLFQGVENEKGEEVLEILEI